MHDLYVKITDQMIEGQRQILKEQELFVHLLKTIIRPFSFNSPTWQNQPICIPLRRLPKLPYQSCILSFFQMPLKSYIEETTPPFNVCG